MLIGLLLSFAGCERTELAVTMRDDADISPPAATAQPEVTPTEPHAIYISDLAGDGERWLAERLQHYVNEMTGRRLPIDANRNVPETAGDVFVLDLNGNSRTALLAGSARHELPPNPGAFFIRTTERGEQRMVVISGRGLSGLGYGVFDYLERYCRVGFFADGVHVPRMSSVPMLGLDYTGVPAFEIREGFYGNYEIGQRRDLRDKLDSVEMDWRLARKLSGGRGEMARKIFGPQKVRSGRRIEPAIKGEHFAYFPKGIFSDGFSNWRGPKYYGGCVIDSEREAKTVLRLIEGPPLPKDQQPDTTYGYLTFYMGGTMCESGEFAEESNLLIQWGAELSQEYTPGIVGYLQTYGPTRFEAVSRIPVPALVQDLEGYDQYYMPLSMRMDSGRYRRLDYFAGQPFLYSLVAGGIAPAFRPYIHHIRQMREDPKAGNCVGLTQHVDGRTRWLRQDLMTALGWDPLAVTFEGWCRDVAERRFGVQSAANMAESIRKMALGLEISTWLTGVDRYAGGNTSLMNAYFNMSPKGVAFDWFAITHGNVNVRFIREALRSALKEADQQHGNVLYDTYIALVCRELVNRSFNQEIIRAYSAYFKACQAIDRNDRDAAQRYEQEFERRSNNLEAIVFSLVDVYGTTEEYSWVALDGRMAASSPGEKRRGMYMGWQNCHNLHGREVLARLTWPRVAVLLDYLQDKLARSDTLPFPQKGRDMWEESFAPSPELGFYFYTAVVEEMKAAELRIFNDFINDDFDDLPRFKGTTAEAAQRCIERLSEIDCLYFEDMTTPEEIAEKYPLSDPIYHSNTSEPVRIRNGSGKWSGSYYEVQPYFRGAQAVYDGSQLGRYVPLDESGQVTLTFSYRNASTMRDDDEVSFLLAGLQMEDMFAAGLRFYNDGDKRPTPEVMPRDFIQIELDAPAWASPWKGKQLFARTGAEGTGEAGPNEFHSVTMRYDHATRMITIDGDEVGHVEKKAPYPFIRGAFYIQGFYPMTGEPAKIQIKDIKLNGEPIELYTGDFRIPDQGPMVVDIPLEVE